MSRNVTVSYLDVQVCEGGAFKITIQLYDSEGNLVVPTSLYYTLLDENEDIVNERESVSLELVSSQTVWIYGADLPSPGMYYFVLRGTYNEESQFDLPLRAYATFRVLDFPGV